MQGEKKGHDYGPSWGDFCHALEDFCSATGKLAMVEVTRVPRASGGCNLYFRVIAFSGYDHCVRVGERGEGHSWPANEWTTVPSMLWALLYRIDKRMADDQALAESQASF
jgi:hypothetical protein